MGATVTTGKLASAFKADNGNIVYVLFEETYEKNCYPHTPHWSCFFIGGIDMAMKRIFLHASSCEGGMLQNRNGHITPEGYIAGWLKELSEPVIFHDCNFELKVGKSFYSALPAESMEMIAKVLTDIGRQDVLNVLTSGEQQDVSLYRDTDLIVALYNGMNIGPWRIIKESQAPIRGVRYVSLGYSPTAAKNVTVNIPAFLKIDGENRLIQNADGTWSCDGWEYSVISGYVSRLWESEMQEPGSYRKRIKTFRDAIKAAPQMPEGMKVAVDLTIPLESKYQQQNVQELPNLYPTVKTDAGYELVVVQDPDMLWKLTNLPESCTKWISPNLPTSEQQLDLWAA